MACELDDLIRRRGKPDMIVSDNGTEFDISRRFEVVPALHDAIAGVMAAEDSDNDNAVSLEDWPPLSRFVPAFHPGELWLLSVRRNSPSKLLTRFHDLDVAHWF